MRHARQGYSPEPGQGIPRGPRRSRRIDPLTPTGTRLPVPRTLRLAIVVLIAAGGVSVVLAMVVAVVSVGTARLSTASSSHPLHRVATAQGRTGGPGAAPRQSRPTPGASVQPPSAHATRTKPATHRQHAAPGPRARRRTLARFSGSGSVRTRDFAVRQPGTWGLSWHYACPAGTPGVFVVTEAHTQLASTVDVARTGRHGQGLLWTSGDTGQHWLLVATQCSWSISIVAPQS